MRRMNFHVLLFFFMISTFLSGCTQFTTKIGVLPAQVDTLPETHYSQVLVDDSSLRVTAPQNQWGMELLMDQDDERIRIFNERLILLGSPIIPVPNKP